LSLSVKLSSPKQVKRQQGIDVKPKLDGMLPEKNQLQGDGECSLPVLL
jgi:hypothetical protein